MRKSSLLLLDRVIAGSTGQTIYTDTKFNDVLGMFDKHAIQGILDQVTGNCTACAVDLEMSNDGENWVTKTANWLNFTGLSGATTQSILTGTQDGSTPMLAFARLKITITVSSGSGGCHLKLLMCQRDEG